MAQDNKAQSEIRYLNPVSVDVKKKKYCRFKKLGINTDMTAPAPLDEIPSKEKSDA